MCCSKAKWKREVVQNHKFDFVYVEDFKQNDPMTKMKYVFVHLLVFKIFLIYVADLWTAGILLIFDRWSSTIQPAIDFDISKWIYVGCIFISFILLIWDWNEAMSIVASKDIGQALTSIISYRYYTLRSFAHYGFFCKINKQKKRTDDIAFFVFFTFKGWMRLILAEVPRQVVNATTLYSIIRSNLSRDWMNIQAYGHNTVERLTMALMAFTFVSFVISATLLAIAFILYIPLLFHIRGNLKEYCCHKIDKRIDELVKHHYRKRDIERKKIARAEAKGDFTHLKKKERKDKNRPKRQPTLPELDDGSVKISSPPEYNLTNRPPPLPPLPPLPLLPPPPPPYESRFNKHIQYNPNLHTNPIGLAYNPNPHPPYLNSSRPAYNNSNLRLPELVQNSVPRLNPNPPRITYNSNPHPLVTPPPRSKPRGYTNNSNPLPQFPNSNPSGLPNIPGRPYNSSTNNNAPVSTHHVPRNKRFVHQHNGHNGGRI